MLPGLMPAFRTFLFDLDGTTIDHFEAIHRCYVHTLPKLGLPAPTAAQVRQAIGGGLENALARFVPADRIGEAVGIYRAYWNETMLDGVKEMPGALELLKAIKAWGGTSAVLTNKIGGSSRLICDKLGFTPYLAAVIGASDTPWLKPARELSAHALSLVQGEPASALMVGDSPYDIQAAHNGGFPAWAVATGTHSEAELSQEKADRIFPDLFALRAALG